MKVVKKIPLVLLVGLLFFTMTASASAKKAPVTPGTVVWQLTKARVVDQGQTVETKEGTLVTGFIVEAKAKSRLDSFIKNGDFRLELTVFKPKKDMAGQKAGRWYVSGAWVIDANGNPAGVKEWHKPGVARGFIRAELDFNPAATPRNWTALATLPMSTVDTRWARGQGTYSVNAGWDGDLFFELLVWPVNP